MYICIKYKVLIEDFLEPLTKTRFFIEEETREYYADCEWSNNFLSNEIVNKYGCFNDMIEGEDNFPYQLIDVSVEKGDGKDEETATAIFKRVSDGKQFTLSVQDAGFIGPSTLSTSGYLEEL